MDHLRISGTEPSSVILLQNKVVLIEYPFCPESMNNVRSYFGVR